VSEAGFPLTAVVLTVLAAEGLDDVRAAIGHGAGIVCHPESLSLNEVGTSGLLVHDDSYRRGAPIGAAGQQVEAFLAERAAKTGRTVSTLDRFFDEAAQALADDYMRHYGLCLVRPLHAYGELVGVLALHFAHRTALPEVEFDALRRFAECAGIALSNARTRSELREFAYSDPLTGLANRRRLEVEFTRLGGQPASLLLIDFDGLKAVNDTLGYDRGDMLIQAIGTRLAAAARNGEFVVRFGGDEFVIILPGATRSEALERADEITATLDVLDVPEDLARLFKGASVGSATAVAGEDFSEVLRRANSEMRSRKRRRKTDRELLSEEESDVSFGYHSEA
jgi:diguanylate cyclase (GGDEF)-like protein